MWPNTFEIVTALTLTVIGAILLLYFIVLKRKGWLTDESSTETFYLCPNPECKKVFEKPVQLTDLSTRPPRGYLACPHCGGDLDTTSMGVSKSKKDHEPLPLKEAQLRTENLPVITENSELETSDEAKIPKKQTAPKSTSKPKVKTKKYEETIFKTPQTCSHFFGYVRTVPKDLPVPDECLQCPKLVECVRAREQLFQKCDSE